MKQLTIDVDGLTDEQVAYIQQVIQEQKRKAAGKRLLNLMQKVSEANDEDLSEEKVMELALEAQQWARKEIRKSKQSQ